MIQIEMALKFLKSNVKAIAALVLLAVLVGGGFYAKHWYNDQITQSYNLGVSDTDRKWKDVQQQNKDENQSYKDEQQIASDILERKLAEEQAKNAELQAQLNAKQDAYSRSDAGKKQGLDNQFVDIYNESLGVK